MSKNLRLVVNNVASTHIGVRPIHLQYFYSVNDPLHQPSKTSRAKTIVGAVRASIVRVLTGQFDRVVIYHEDGHKLAEISRIKKRGKYQEVRIFGWFGILE